MITMKQNRMIRSNPMLLRFGAVGAFLIMLIGMNLMTKAPFMSASWDGFKQSMTEFFQNGLGGPGMEGVGIAIAVIGVVAACISFIVHRFNPQSRMPGWIMCLVIGLVGAIAMGGVSKPLQLLSQARDLIYGWFGL